MSDLGPYIEPDIDDSGDRSSDKGRKYQDKPDYQEQEEVVPVPFSNPRRLRQGDQRELI